MNSYELENRRRKVAALLAKIPLCYSVTERESLAVILEKSSQQWRDSLAVAVGVRSPSVTTWGEVVAAVRARAIATEAEVSKAAHLRRVG